MNIIVPAIAVDASKVLANYIWFKRNIDFDNIVIIGNDDARNVIDEAKKNLPNDDKRIFFYDENQVVDYKEVNEYFSGITGEKHNNKVGWYYQQFLKLGYARICIDEDYLLWDSDTIPLKKYQYSTSDGRLFFDVKDEYNPPYFETISNLFDLTKVGNFSFISEHMIINTQIMKEILDELEKNGKLFWQTILDAIPIQYLAQSGFSEYETYGTYVINNYPEAYTIRQWTSLRQGTQFFDYHRLKQHDVDWLGKWFDAVSFEKNDTIGNHRKWLYRNRVLQRLFTFEQLVECERLYDRLRYEVRNLWKKQ